MRIGECNKKNTNHISLLVIKSVPKHKYRLPATIPNSQNYSISNMDCNQTIQSNCNINSKEQLCIQSKPAVVTLSFDEQTKKKQHVKRNVKRKLLTSACIQQNARKHNALVREAAELERKANLEQFVHAILKKLLVNMDTIQGDLLAVGKGTVLNIKHIITINKFLVRITYVQIPHCIQPEICLLASLKVRRAKQYPSKEILIKQEKPPKKDYFIFGMTDKNLPLNKIEIYRDFLWKVNYSNDIYVATPETNDSGYKAYIGSGNNSIMVKGILKRRYWWTIVDKPNLANFVWTQLKNNSVFEEQTISSFTQRLEIDQENIQTEPNSKFDEHRYIFRKNDLKLWETHMEKHGKSEEKLNQQTYIKRMWFFNKKNVTNIDNSFSLKVHNHFQNNFYLGNKKALFYNLRRYYQVQNKNVFTIIPQTFHITKGVDDPQYHIFVAHYNKLEKLKHIDKSFRNIWIAKPGENSNRGNGISVCFSLDDVRLRLRGKQKNSDGKQRTFIIQKYIQKPLLYQKRKFDIRHYLLITCINGDFKAYWYQQGYIRTSSVIFSLRNTKDLFTHLTNDAIQKNGQQYGKYEKGNKVSYDDFESYLKKNYRKKGVSFYQNILPRMKKIAIDAVRSTYFILDSFRRQRNFQVFGLDFMIDQEFNPWLIQCNTNPCLELSCPLLARIIPGMIENMFKMCLDPLFPPPEIWPSGKRQFFGQNPIGQNKFQLIFDQQTEGKEIMKKYKDSQRIDVRMGKIQEDDEVFQDDGNQLWEQNTQT